jgi:hypothetical protein
MQEISYWFYLSVATNVSFFVLFCIKAYGAFVQYVIPLLEKRRHEINERWFALQEKHLVIVSKKKQLATQFLQQEKQIALLTAKLEAWHLVCVNKKQERERAIAERTQAMNERAAIQQHTLAERELVATTVKKVLDEVAQEMRKNTESTFVQYMSRAKIQLSGVEKKDTLYESSYAKKTEGA